MRVLSITLLALAALVAGAAAQQSEFDGRWQLPTPVLGAAFAPGCFENACQCHLSKFAFAAAQMRIHMLHAAMHSTQPDVRMVHTKKL